MTSGGTAPAGPPPEPRSQERTTAALHRRFAQMLDTWSSGNAAAYADLFAPDVRYVGFDGVASTGRDELRESHDDLFRGVLRGSRLVGEIETLRVVADDVAVLHCRGAVLTRGRTVPGRGRESVQTIVARRAPEGWTFTDFHNSRYRPLPRLARWYVRYAASRRPATTVQ